MKQIDAAYSRLVDGDGLAALKMVRLSRNLQQMGYGTYQVLVYDGASSEARSAADKAREADAKIVELFDEAEAAAPWLAADLDPLRAPLVEVRALVARSIELGLANDFEAAQAVNREMDTKIAALSAQLTAFNDARIEANEAASAELTNQTNSTALTLLIALLIATAAALGVGIMVASSIVRSLTGISDRMQRLVAGDTTIEVPCAARKDELGAMGAALIIFRDAAIEKTRLEAEGAALRGQSDEERARSQRAADAAAREQAAVVAALGEGLDHLTRGDLTFSISQSFPEDYVKLKDDFNAAIGQLKDAMSVVAGNVSAIRSGAGEIAQASDDLSRRTEQQAASLEETAAALDEITATVNRTASGARQASETVQAA
ncbi:methyl-accepting chemotaxis protein, partial [Brevundimonas sp.]|uniref:methyl-accepting chemotaxis protein n=1 Tax=Brevundimonas sp. TaxID=1871086 RepID=UPI00260EC3E4